MSLAISLCPGNFNKTGSDFELEGEHKALLLFLYY